MEILELIYKKKAAMPLTQQEMEYVVDGYTDGRIQDCQMAAWLMAVCLRGLNKREIADLTMAMVRSGHVIDLSDIAGVKVDKHSTGGVADVTTLIVLPLVAAAGVTVAKMSGRGLGFTGGTLDKLESIPGFVTELSEDEYRRQLRRTGMAVISQSAKLVPADRVIYELRGITGTVDSVGLIAASIMSKKIAAGADKILLDVKVGSGAFMKELPQAIELAETMVGIGHMVGRETRAVVTSMNEPLGCAIGNSMEIKEAVEVLSGGGSSKLREVCLKLGAQMLVMAGAANGISKARQQLLTLLSDGSALEKLKELVKNQRGNVAAVEDTSLLPRAAHHIDLLSDRDGYVQSMDATQLGYAAVLLGGGRLFKGQAIDLAVGLKMNCRIGQRIAAGDALVGIEANDLTNIDEVSTIIKRAIVIEPCRAAADKAVLGTVDATGFHAATDD